MVPKSSVVTEEVVEQLRLSFNEGLTRMTAAHADALAAIRSTHSQQVETLMAENRSLRTALAHAEATTTTSLDTIAHLKAQALSKDKELESSEGKWQQVWDAFLASQSINPPARSSAHRQSPRQSPRRK